MFSRVLATPQIFYVLLSSFVLVVFVSNYTVKGSCGVFLEKVNQQEFSKVYLLIIFFAVGDRQVMTVDSVDISTGKTNYVDTA